MRKTKEQKEEKNQKDKASGITLIALVVTIIVLMIISGITVATLMGENGIIKRAGDAKETQRGAAVQDEVTLAIAENAMIDQLNSVKGGNENKKGKAEVVVDLVEKGYLHNDERNKLLGENGEEEQDTITIGSITIDFSKLPGEEEEGDYAPYDNPYIPDDFTHTSGEWNTGFTIVGKADTDNAGDEFVWVPCVTDQAKVKPKHTVQTFERHLSNTTVSDFINAMESGSYSSLMEIDSEITYGPSDINLSDEENSATSIRKSVEKYGGFYIAKYEASQDSGTAKSVSGASVWNNINRLGAIIVAEEMIPTSTGCKSALISGECWDTTMQWMKQTNNNNTNRDYDVNSDRKRLL